MSIQVLIVDDSRFFRDRISEILNLNSQIEIIGTAENGRDAIDKTIDLKPDVITMDYEMPRMDGITAIREIMSKQPTPILMFSSMSYEGARTTLDALAAGAIDFLPKNFESVSKDKTKANQILIDRVVQIAKKSSQLKRVSPAGSESISYQSESLELDNSVQKNNQISSNIITAKEKESITTGSVLTDNSALVVKKNYKVVAIGASTGGPIAVQGILKQLPRDYPLPIILVQHMPAAFTKAYAERLNQICDVSIQEAEDGMQLQPGNVYIAPGGKQLMISSKAIETIKIIDGDHRLHYKPSVDLTFASLAKHFPKETLGIVMTGMGSDGCDGARLLHREGSSIWIQDEQSCVVYGMPAAIMRSGFYHEVVELDKIGERLIEAS